MFDWLDGFTIPAEEPARLNGQTRRRVRARLRVGEGRWADCGGVRGVDWLIAVNCCG